MKNKAILFVVLFLLVFNIAVAQPFQTSAEDLTGVLDIIYLKNKQVPQGANIDMHFHVFNSTAVSMTSSEIDYCTIHLYNMTGNHILRQNLTYNGVEWGIVVNDTITGSVGDIPYTIWCFGTQSGFVSGELFISVDGVSFEGRANAMFTMTFSLLVLMTFYLLLAFNWDFTLFEIKKENNNNAIKGLFIWLFIWLVPLAIQFSLEIAEGFGATKDMITLSETFYFVSVIVGWVVTVYFIVFFIYNVALYLARKGKETK